MKFLAVFTSGEAKIGNLEFDGSWEDFAKKYEFDQVLQRKVELENFFGCSVSVKIMPIRKSADASALQPSPLLRL